MGEVWSTGSFNCFGLRLISLADLVLLSCPAPLPLNSFKAAFIPTALHHPCGGGGVVGHPHHGPRVPCQPDPRAQLLVKQRLM